MEFKVKTSDRQEIIDITRQIIEFADKNWKKEKACIIFVPHSTCSIILNENHDEAVKKDIIGFLNKQIPPGIWGHDEVDNNADAHIKASIIGSSQVIPIKDGKLQIGAWQGIGLAEFDGPRERKVIVELL